MVMVMTIATAMARKMGRFMHMAEDVVMAMDIALGSFGVAIAMSYG